MLACHLVHCNQCDNSFVLGSVCPCSVVFSLCHSHVTSQAALKGALLSCSETLAADSKLRFPLVSETSERLWAREENRKCWIKEQLI